VSLLAVFVASAFVLSAALSAPASAAHFTISKSPWTGSDGERATLKVVPDPYDCGTSGCYNEYTDIRVSPCPPGQPCHDGVYTFRYVKGMYTSFYLLILDFNTTYEFMGHWHKDIGISYGGTCHYQCSFDQEVDAATYTTGPMPMIGHWDISIDHDRSNVDTVWVNASLVGADMEANPCGAGTCFYHRFWMTADPLPLYPHLDPTFGYGSPLSTIQVALSPGVTYTFGGQMQTFCSGRGMGSDVCNVTLGDVIMELDATEFTATPVAVEHSTWGRIKSLYR